MRASVLIAVLCLAGCGHASLVKNPAPMAAAPATDVTEQAILDALPRHGWSVEDVAPGRIVAFLSIRAHLLRCEIRYDAQYVTVAYLDSDHLNAKRTSTGAVSAHRQVNTWMQNLASDIQAAVAAAQAPATAPAPAPADQAMQANP